MKYGFIGTGCMGSALATACAKAIGPEDILLSNRSPEKAQALAEKLGLKMEMIDMETKKLRQTDGPLLKGV